MKNINIDLSNSIVNFYMDLVKIDSAFVSSFYLEIEEDFCGKLWFILEDQLRINIFNQIKNSI